jgi:hypothetical protein
MAAFMTIHAACNQKTHCACEYQTCKSPEDTHLLGMIAPRTATGGVVSTVHMDGGSLAVHPSVWNEWV